MLYQLSYAHQRCFQNLTTFRREPAFEIGLNFRGPDSAVFRGVGGIGFFGKEVKNSDPSRPKGRAPPKAKPTSRRRHI